MSANANKIILAFYEGRQVRGSWMQIASPLVAETLARMGYDLVVLDLQHSEMSVHNVLPLINSIELGGAEAFVRLRWNRPEEIMYALDIGASGIIVPMVESSEDVQSLVFAAHYPPFGMRSFGPRRPLLRHGTAYGRIARETFLLFAMIETVKGLENLDEILNVKGLDGVFIGPADLSQSLTGVPQADSADPVVVEAIAHIRERAYHHGRKAGIFCGSGTFAARKLKEGFDMVTLTPDLAMIDQAARAALVDSRIMN